MSKSMTIEEAAVFNKAVRFVEVIENTAEDKSDNVGDAYDNLRAAVRVYQRKTR